MHAEIWFFFNSETSQDITVLNRESARTLARLLSPEDRKVWKVRKNRTTEVMTVENCPEVLDFSTEDVSQVEEMLAFESELVKAANTMRPAAANPNALIKAPEPVEAEPIKVPEILKMSEVSKEIRRAPVAPKKVAVKIPGPAETQLAVAENDLGADLGFSSDETPSAAPPPPPKPVDRKMAAAKGANTRKHPRVPLHLRVVLIAGGKSFRSFSVNVSKGGLLLEHAVPPELMGKPCRVIIGSADLKENIEFMAKLSSDPKHPRALEFVEAKDFFLRKLESWIDSIRNARTENAA